MDDYAGPGVPTFGPPIARETDRSEAVAALAEALHNDPALCQKHSPNGHPRWMQRPLCVSVAERLAALRPEREEPGLTFDLNDTKARRSGPTYGHPPDVPRPVPRPEREELDRNDAVVANSLPPLQLDPEQIAAAMADAGLGVHNFDLSAAAEAVVRALGPHLHRETDRSEAVPFRHSFIEHVEPSVHGFMVPAEETPPGERQIDALLTALQGSDRDSRPSLAKPSVLDFFCTPRGNGLSDWCSVHGDIQRSKSIAAHIEAEHDLTWDEYDALEEIDRRRSGLSLNDYYDRQRSIGIAAAREADHA